MKKILYISFLTLGFISCKKEYDTPPLTYPEEGTPVTIDSLRQMYQMNGPATITASLDLYATVTMDENDGNIYKNVFIQDNTGAINLRLKNGGGLYQGDSMRISLQGCYLNQFSGVMQIDSVDADWNVVKLDVDQDWPPEVVSIDQITTAKESELVQINNVQFVQWQLDETYADKDNLDYGEILLEDANSNTIVVRSSGYASFADQMVAQGNGSIVCIVTHFNGEVHLLIRSYDEINMSGPRFNGLLMLKNFNDDEVTSDGWTTYSVIPSIAEWETSTAGGASNPYVQISNYDGTNNHLTDEWLISPSVDLTGYTSPSLSFDNAKNYIGDPLEVYVSTNYTSGDPNSATWTDLTLSANWSSGSFVFVNSGDIDLTPYISNNVHIGFRYQGSSTDGSTWELDNILIKG